MSNRRAIATSFVRRLQQSGFNALWAGGCVRDELLGLEPNDYDIVTAARPDQIKAVFDGQTAILCGESFGVVKIHQDGDDYDIATFRCDGDYSDGRRPDDVVFVDDPRLDADRRDFTFNAMFFNPLNGQHFDYHGGRKDLEARIVRAVGDPFRRFKEDRLRMMRAGRIGARFECTIDPATEAAVKAMASDIGTVSAERIADELGKMLTCKFPLSALDFMMRTGLMKHTIWEVAKMDGPLGEQTPVWHPEGNAWKHTRLVLSHLIGGSFELMMGALLHDIGKCWTQEYNFKPWWPRLKKPLPWWCGWLWPGTTCITNNAHAEVGAKMAKTICQRLKLTNQSTERIVELVAMHMRMHEMHLPEVRRSKLTRLLQRPNIMEMIELQHADVMGTGLPMDVRLSRSNKEFYLGKLAELASGPEHQRTDAKPLVTGKTMLGMGLKQGRLLGFLKDAALNAQLEGDFADETGGEQWLRNNLERLKAEWQAKEAPAQ